MQQATIINLSYLIASVLFIFGLKGLTHPRTAVKGNLTAAIAMLIAVVVTLLDQNIVGFGVIIAGIIIGGAIGMLLAIKIKMTDIPQLVALFNGFGGGASVFVAGAALIEVSVKTKNPELHLTVATVVSGLVGAVTFWGSLIAFGKLQGLKFANDVRFPGQQLVNSLCALSAIGAGILVVLNPTSIIFYWLLVIVASVLGVLTVIPIGGADMPVVIALLNSYSGLAAAATGFVLGNNILIIAGSLVGASGMILSSIMCKAMNRSLGNVLFGVLEPTADTASADEVYAGKVKSTSADEAAMLFDDARRVVFVPGYGMAVAQAQHAVRDLATLLESKDVEVDFAIHPVAGRMPGHMNVLLAEADISYDKLKEMDDVNPTFQQTDVAIVLGANDVVNPVARTDPKSAIAGMPILDVDKSRTVIVIKRSLSPGFAGIPNPLFAMDNTLMLFGDAKKAILDLITAIKES
ncbi:MAG: NAD synthetase [Nitrospinae bacterium]|jgi:NAD(P) transhydrogenase subunit beta|nr:NAD synthetase [Nitrospinota bacterium]MDP7555021.1 NAD(P)(+) transhydrogenase (Re/Si-specific) subunit beta [Nitrospinota bacterium]HJN02845.1 NAD(P)(+) transhydrogenase (Re/Si-specific) subunit beta [Nitrospinota bacterium]